MSHPSPNVVHVVASGSQATYSRGDESVTLTDAQLWRRRQLASHGECFYDEFKDEPIPVIQDQSHAK